MARLSGYRRPLKDAAGRYPSWLTQLGRDRASGVYVIRDRRSKVVLYVGESHTGNLYKTLIRHFQQWDLSIVGRTAFTYDADKVDVAVAVMYTSSDMTETATRRGTRRSSLGDRRERQVTAAQNQRIRRMRPRDNSISPEDNAREKALGDVPF